LTPPVDRTDDLVDIEGMSMGADPTVLLRPVTDEIGEAVVVTDTSGLVEYWSRGAEDVFGLTAVEAHGRAIGELIEARFTACGGDALPAPAGGRPAVGCWAARRPFPDGREGRLEGRTTQLLRAEGVEPRFLVVARLVDDEVRVRASDRYVLDSMTEGVVVQRTDGAIEACNPAAERILGLTAAQMNGRSSIDPRWRAIHEDGSDFPGADHPAMVTLRTGQPVVGAIMGVRTPDGAQRWLSINTQPIIAGTGAPPNGVVATFTDVTELRRRGAALQDTLGRLERMLDASNDGYWDHDLATGEIFMSPALRSIFGTESRSDRLDGLLVGATHPEDVERLVRDMEETRSGGKTRIDLEIRIRWSDGEWRWVNLRGRVSGCGNDGQPTHIAGVIIDVDERRRLHGQLENALAENVRLVQKLEHALGKALSGYLPVCAWCKAVRDESGDWVPLDRYVEQHSDALVTHGMCPTCYEREVGELPSGG
jgi:PAS domain S-box-containing protein